MKTLVAIALLALLSSTAVAQSDNLLVPPPVKVKCNSHQRQGKKPWTWLKSNMCQEDYDVWVEPRRHDHFYKDKVFWAGVAVIGASIVLDAHSTSRGFGKGYEEGNPLLGPHPSNKRIAGFAVLDFGIHVGLHVAAWEVSHKDPSKPWRVLGQWGVPVGAVASNGRAGVHNYLLQSGKKL